MKVGLREVVAIILTLSLTAIMVYAAPAPGSSDIQRGTNVFRNNTAAAPDTAAAQGGNVTQYNVSQKMQSQNWATFWGTVRGQWVLEAGVYTNNGTNYQIYNWSKVENSLTGYIFFANDSKVNWNNLQSCNGVSLNDEDNTLGLTGPDNVSQTYIDKPHPALAIGGQSIGAGDSMTANTSSNGGNLWQGVVIESDSGDSGMVYTALINNANENYAGTSADYQIIVPVSATTHTRNYYVFASLS